MVDLTNVTTQELFTELAKRKDGRAYLDLAYSKQQMEKTAQDAQERKGQEILDFLIEEFCHQAEFYQDEFPYTWEEAINQEEDAIVDNALEDKDFKNLIHEFFDLTVG